jgi:hypothetical protein
MKIKCKCVSKEKMMKAIKTGSVPFEAHLKECRSCNEMFEFLSSIDILKRQPLEPVSEGLISRFSLIPVLVGSHKPARSVTGAVKFDSWSQLPALAARDGAKGMERRMRLKAGRITLELVAEHRPEGWEFTARVYDKRKVDSNFVLKIGRQKIPAGLQSCFFWSSEKPPRRIQLLSPKVFIDFGPLNWK